MTVDHERERRPPDQIPVRANLRWGILWGISFTGAAGVYVYILAIVRDSVWFERYGVTLWTIWAAYGAAGMISGILLGLLRPVTATRLGATLVGILVAIPCYTVVWFATDGGPYNQACNFDGWGPSWTQGRILVSSGSPRYMARL